jgi:quercetin dioxygenase-like cupin family protein
MAHHAIATMNFGREQIVLPPNPVGFPIGTSFPSKRSKSWSHPVIPLPFRNAVCTVHPPSELNSPNEFSKGEIYMTDSTILNAENAETGTMGEDRLIAGKNVALRRWNESAGDGCETRRRAYETLGYLVSGQLEVTIDEKKHLLDPGDSWMVPPDTDHSYRVVEAIVAVEATSPPARTLIQ